MTVLALRLSTSTTASAGCMAMSRADVALPLARAGGRRGADHLDHQRRAYRDLAGRRALADLYRRYLGADWYAHLDDPAALGACRRDPR